MTSPTPDFFSIFEVLSGYKVDFIIVGGVCGVLHGAPVTTFDLDIVHSRTQENLDRLLPALQELGAYYRGRQDQRVKPDLSHLSSPGHQLLMTRSGPLDLLGTIGAGPGYEDLVLHSEEFAIGRLRLRILSLEKLIEIKEAHSPADALGKAKAQKTGELKSGTKARGRVTAGPKKGSESLCCSFIPAASMIQAHSVSPDDAVDFFADPVGR